MRAPEMFAHDDDGRRLRPLVGFGQKSSGKRLGSEHREVVARYESSRQSDRAMAADRRHIQFPLRGE